MLSVNLNLTFLVLPVLDVNADAVPGAVQPPGQPQEEAERIAKMLAPAALAWSNSASHG